MFRLRRGAGRHFEIYSSTFRCPKVRPVRSRGNTLGWKSIREGRPIPRRQSRASLLSHATPPNTEVGRAISSLGDWEIQRVLEYHHLFSHVRARLSAIVIAFDKWLQRREHSKSRGDLAYLRTLTPLLDSRESGCIERRWEEISDKTLSRFIEAGIDREKILLDRPSELQQAQRNAERDPLDFVALYGQLWDQRAFTGRNTNKLIARWVARQRRK